MQRIAERRIASENPFVFGDGKAIGIKTDMPGIHAPLHAFVGIGARHAVPVAVESNEALGADPHFLRHAGVKGNSRRDESSTLFLKHVIDALVTHFRMLRCLGVSDKALTQMGI